MISAHEGPLAALRESEIRLLADIAATLGDMGETAQEDRRRLLDVANDLREAFFLVVIIGEFNAGKSSFINALLGDNLLPVGITPTTETIEVIRYGDEPNRRAIPRDNGTREWTHPGTGAPGVALVDTPGTGSVFQKHETTAKAFLHRADLVIFVISAKRALAETERLYLELARDFGKKIILVVNQIDLLAPNEQQEVRRFIERQVKDLLDLNPLIFMTSAREALKAIGSGAAADDPGGINTVRAHLRGVFSEAPPAQQKLLAQLDLAERIVRRYLEAMRGKVNLVQLDTSKVRDVQTELEHQAEGLDKQLKGARLEIDRVFDGLRQRGNNFVNSNMSVRRIGRIPNKEALQVEFQTVVIGNALRDISEGTTDYINALVDNSRLYWRGVIDRLNQLRDLMEQELGGLDSTIYAEQRETLEQAIRLAETEMRSYSSGKVMSDLQEAFSANMGGFTTSFVAAVGGLFVTLAAIAAQGPIIGAGALPLASLAFVIAAPVTLIGGYVAIRYYRRVTEDARRDLNARIDQLEEVYHQALDNLTQKERNRLTQYGKQILTPVFSRLASLAERYTEQEQTLRDRLTHIATLRAQLVERRPNPPA